MKFVVCLIFVDTAFSFFFLLLLLLFFNLFVCLLPLLLLFYSGETWQQKLWEYDGSNGLDSIRSKLQEVEAKAIVVSKLDEVACE